MWARMKKAVYWTVLLFVVTIAGVVGKQIGGELGKPSKAETLSKLVSEAAAKLNAQAPKKLDEITTLVRAEASIGQRLTIYYTLENYDAYAKDFSLDRVRSAAIKNACDKDKGGKGASPLSLGVIYTYVYTRENGKAIGKFDVSQKDCYRAR
ncbi:hypothetical protein PP918_gp39 [Pseudomonas phage UFJF_PfDIW6]|uniref:Uncharacterized protein n=1 Tax=Pseudomonas phage UFJF_PfDIW6 TaxID=2927622 RepID=A0AAE9GA71_9CAUD|nr:hypothetical protein PP918_gp39 [Pseudomonas phage UFJF_PfDIW6]UNY42247.1 hypothetical protein UFJFPfDIW6_00039 [Pseudomonas phage UFJF_PfDIW6]